MRNDFGTNERWNMPRRKERPQRSNRAGAKKGIEEYIGFENDAKRLGRETAIFNAGKLAGDREATKRAADRALPAFKQMAMDHKGKWTAKERRLFDRAVAYFERRSNAMYRNIMELPPGTPRKKYKPRKKTSKRRKSKAK